MPGGYRTTLGEDLKEKYEDMKDAARAAGKWLTKDHGRQGGEGGGHSTEQSPSPASDKR